MYATQREVTRTQARNLLKTGVSSSDGNLYLLVWDAAFSPSSNLSALKIGLSSSWDAIQTRYTKLSSQVFKLPVSLLTVASWRCCPLLTLIGGFWTPLLLHWINAHLFHPDGVSMISAFNSNMSSHQSRINKYVWHFSFYVKEDPGIGQEDMKINSLCLDKQSRRMNWFCDLSLLPQQDQWFWHTFYWSSGTLPLQIRYAQSRPALD